MSVYTTVLAQGDTVVLRLRQTQVIGDTQVLAEFDYITASGSYGSLYQSSWYSFFAVGVDSITIQEGSVRDVAQTQPCRVEFVVDVSASGGRLWDNGSASLIAEYRSSISSFLRSGGESCEWGITTFDETGLPTVVRSSAVGPMDANTLNALQANMRRDTAGSLEPTLVDVINRLRSSSISNRHIILCTDILLGRSFDAERIVNEARSAGVNIHVVTPNVNSAEILNYLARSTFGYIVERKSGLVLESFCSALPKAFQRGIPGTVFIRTSRGYGNMTYLVDFGLSASLTTSVRNENSYYGTVSVSSPELRYHGLRNGDVLLDSVLVRYIGTQDSVRMTMHHTDSAAFLSLEDSLFVVRNDAEAVVRYSVTGSESFDNDAVYCTSSNFFQRAGNLSSSFVVSVGDTFGVRQRPLPIVNVDGGVVGENLIVSWTGVPMNRRTVLERRIGSSAAWVVIKDDTLPSPFTDGPFDRSFTHQSVEYRVRVYDSTPSPRGYVTARLPQAEYTSLVPVWTRDSIQWVGVRTYISDHEGRYGSLRWDFPTLPADLYADTIGNIVGATRHGSLFRRNYETGSAMRYQPTFRMAQSLSTNAQGFNLSYGIDRRLMPGSVTTSASTTDLRVVLQAYRQESVVLNERLDSIRSYRHPELAFDAVNARLYFPQHTAIDPTGTYVLYDCLSDNHYRVYPLDSDSANWIPVLEGRRTAPLNQFSAADWLCWNRSSSTLSSISGFDQLLVRDAFGRRVLVSESIPDRRARRLIPEIRGGIYAVGRDDLVRIDLTSGTAQIIHKRYEQPISVSRGDSIVIWKTLGSLPLVLTVDDRSQAILTPPLIARYDYISSTTAACSPFDSKLALSLPMDRNVVVDIDEEAWVAIGYSMPVTINNVDVSAEDTIQFDISRCSRRRDTTVWVRNDGRDTLTILDLLAESAQIQDSVWIDRSVIGTRMFPGDSVSVSVQLFHRTNNDMIVTIYGRSDISQSDVVLTTMIAPFAPSQVRVYDELIDLGTRHTIDTTVFVHNPTRAVVELEQVRSGDQRCVVLSTLPVLIPPYDSVEIAIRFVRSDTGRFETKLFIMANPCELRDTSTITWTTRYPDPAEYVVYQLDTVRARLGDDVQLVLRQTYPDTVPADSIMFSTTWEYDETVLIPQELPNNQSFPNDNLTQLRFTVVHGVDSVSTIVGRVVGIRRGAKRIEILPGRVVVEDLCVEGGLRRIDSRLRFSAEIASDLLNVTTIVQAPLEITTFDALGRQIGTIRTMSVRAGLHTVSMRDLCGEVRGPMWIVVTSGTQRIVLQEFMW